MHALSKRLDPTKPLIGTFCGIPSPAVVEILGWSDLDFVLLDAEHTQINRTGIEELIRAGDAAGVACVVRVPTHEGDWIGSSLDAGAAGILVPRIETAEQARAVAAASRYTPQGQRGCGPGRAARFGLTLPEYIATANDNLLVAVQVETALGVENIDAIAAVEGIDLVFIGPGDLALSLQAFGPEGQPRLEKAIATVVDACKRHARPIGIFHLNMSDVAGSVERGICFIAAAGDTVFLSRGLAAAKAELGSLVANGRAA